MEIQEINKLGDLMERSYQGYAKFLFLIRLSQEAHSYSTQRFEIIRAGVKRSVGLVTSFCQSILSKAVLIGYFLFFLTACTCDKQEGAQPYLHVHTSASDSGEFWVAVNGAEPQLLLQEAQDYRAVISPNGSWMAVEIKMMSDLTVVRLYSRKDFQFTVAEHDVTKEAWLKVAVEKKLDVQSLNNTRVSIAGWGEGSNSLLLRLAAMIPDEDKPFETEVIIPLE